MNDRDHTAPGEAADEAVAPERLAALLDGRLTGQERDELLKRLARSPDAVALLAQVGAVLGAMEQEQPSQPGRPVRVRENASPAWRRNSTARWWVGAAAVALVVSGVGWFIARDAGVPALGPASYVALLDEPSTRLPASWNGEPWSTTRSEQDVAISPRARGVRLGARLVDLQVAASTSDSAVATIAANIARLVADLPASEALRQRYVAIGARAGESPPTLQRELDEAARAVRIAAGEDAVDLGSWLEAARLAAARRDGTYFRQGASLTMLDEVAGDSSVAPETRATVERVRSTVASGAPAWDQVAGDLTALLAAATRGLSR